MQTTPRHPLARLVAIAAALLVLLAGAAGSLTPASAAGSGRSVVAPAAVPALPAAIVANAERARGSVVRQTSGVTVSAVAIPASLRAAYPGVPATVWRVRVAGRFPPRALRYIVSAGGRPVGYGTPSAHENAAVAVTADSAVLTDAITARYEGAAASDRAPRNASAPAKAGRAAGALASALRPFGAAAPLPVTRVEYNLGYQAYQPPGITGKVELIADVHYPTGLPGGP